MGELLGITVNIFVQFIVWRYLIVYYSLSGDKSKYQDKKVAYNFLFILLGFITYPFLWIVGNIFWPIVIVILIALIYFAVIFSSKWSANEVLPDPFKAAVKPSLHSPKINQPNTNNQFSTTTNVSEDAFFTILQLEGVAKARDIYHQAIQHNAKAILFQESRLNKLAYEELKKGNVNFAIDLFKLNVEAFPFSANCYASLADAFQTKGETNEAITYYKKALEVLIVDHSNTEQFRQSLLTNIKDNLNKLDPCR